MSIEQEERYKTFYVEANVARLIFAKNEDDAVEKMSGILKRSNFGNFSIKKPRVTGEMKE